MRELSIRRGSGGGGRQRGGDGIVREIEALEPMRFTPDHASAAATLRSGRDGGGDGEPGRNLLNGGRAAVEGDGDLAEGDRLRIETPGGAAGRPGGLSASARLCNFDPKLGKLPAGCFRLTLVALSPGLNAPPGPPLRTLSSSVNPNPVGHPDMPIAFKEWAVTVRALSEGEQLVTLRKGGIREEDKHFELEHEQFFLYPTFDHQRNDLVRESHHPELRRALEEGVWPDEEPPPRALLQDGGIPSPTGCESAPGPRSRATSRPRTHASSRASPLPRLDAGLRDQAAALEARAPAARSAARVHRIPRPVTVRVRDEYHGCHSWVEIERLPFEGTPVMADEEFSGPLPRSARSATSNPRSPECR